MVRSPPKAGVSNHGPERRRCRPPCFETHRYAMLLSMRAESSYAATLIVPAPLSTITGECRYSIEGGVPYLPVTNSFHSAV